jgi:hypothetical protein
MASEPAGVIAPVPTGVQARHRIAKAAATAVLAAAIPLAAATAAADPIVPTAQERGVGVSAETIADLWADGTSPTAPTFDPPSLTQTGESEDAEAAPGFSTFHATAQRTAPGVPFVPTTGVARAEQSSSISGDLLAASGSVVLTTDAHTLGQFALDNLNFFLPGPHYWLGFGRDRTSGTAHYEVAFDVAAERPYVLAGALAMSAADPLTFFAGTHAGSLLLRLTGPGGVIHEVEWDQVADGCAFLGACEPADFAIDESGTLAPGSYTLDVATSALALGNCGDIQGFPPCWQPTSTSSFDVSLVVGGCGPSPLESCVAASQGSLVVRESTPGNEKLKASLRRIGAALSPDDFGDPVTGTTRYDVCIYDDAGALVADLVISRAGEDCAVGMPCWRPLSSKGYRYADPAAAASGVMKLSARGGPPLAGRLKVQAGNAAAQGESALPTGITAQLEGSTSARVQVVTSDAACFDATLPSVKQASAVAFRAISP